MQLLFILLRYDSRMHYFAGSKNVEVVSSSIFCAEWKCMCIKCICVVHTLAVVILVKCLLYRTTESDTLAAIQPERHHVSQGKKKQCHALAQHKPFSLGNFILYIEPGPPASSASSLTTRLPHKKVVSLPVAERKPWFLLHSVWKLSGLSVIWLWTAHCCKGGRSRCTKRSHSR